MKKMNLLKILTLTLALSLSLALVACGGKNGADEKNNSSADQTQSGSQFTEEEIQRMMEEEAERAAAAAAEADSGMFADMDTVDLKGEAVSSSVFAENTLTLVNVWNTGCTPCIMEMPELQKISEDYAEKGVAVKGLIYEFQEGLSDDLKKEVEEIMANAEADFQQLLVSKAMLDAPELANLQAFPTTYMVDSEGKIVGAALGSNDYDGWSKVIDDTLKTMNNG